MAFDDKRFFTFAVQKSLKVLVVTDQIIDAEYLANALDPSTPLEPGMSRPYRVERRLTSDPGGALPSDSALAGYSAVFINNVERLGDAQWSKLNTYVRQGGGLVVGIGQRTNVQDYNGPIATQVLPAKLEKSFAPRGLTNLARVEASHPIFDERYLKDLLADLANLPVVKYMTVQPEASTATIAFFADGAPALIERAFGGQGGGKSLLWTTPLSRRPRPDDANAWNELPNLLYWSFVYLMDQTVAYLSGASTQRLSYESGQDVILSLVGEPASGGYMVQGPEGNPFRVNSPENAKLLPVVGPRVIGQWSVSADGPASDHLGFSINPPARESDLSLLGTEELDPVYGKEMITFATGPDDIERATSERRIGQELFPWIMAVILLLVTAENLLANTFYRQPAEAVRTVPAANPA
jgi:hypothetical protein